METHSTFTAKDDFQHKLLAISDNSSEILSKIKRSINEDLCLTNKDSYHFITQFIKPKTNVEHTLFSLLYRDIYQAEVLSGNSAKITLAFALKMLSVLIKQQEHLLGNDVKALAGFEDTLEHFKAHLQTQACVANKSSLESIVEHLSDGDKNLSTAIIKAIELAGMEGRIFIEDSKQSNYVVESKAGYSFTLNPFSFMVGNIPWDKRECKVLIVDGLVEKVSEIDQILNSAMIAKQPLAIIAHGFSEEVVATIKANNDKGNFDIMPIRMHHDISSINTIKDISVVCNTVPVTHMLGDLLSFVKWDTLKTIDRIKVTRSSTVFECKESQNNVSQHVKELIAKRQSPHTIEDVRVLLDDRLRSMASHSVILSLPNMSLMMNDSYRIKIDLCLRNVKTILGYGTVNLEGICKTYMPRKNNVFDKILLTSLQQTVDLFNSQESSLTLPTLSVALGIMLAGKTCLNLVTASGLVEAVS